MKLYWHPVSLMPWRVRIALAEKSLAYEEVIIDLPGGASHRPEFLVLNPFGQVPVLEDEGMTFAESTAILEYLEDKHPEPALMPPSAPARADVRQLMCWSNGPWMMSWKRGWRPLHWVFPIPQRCGRRAAPNSNTMSPFWPPGWSGRNGWPATTRLPTSAMRR